jgi:xanthine dehydrogenase accessory factor
VTVDVLEVARELSARGEPYAVATIVWRRAPSSGQVGARAVVTPDGRIRGWLSGACAEPAVISEAKKALEDGAPRLVFLGPPEEVEEHRRDGVVSIPISCESEGALEVYVEPILPSPHLVVVGRSPAVDALAQMAVALGWRALVVDDEPSAEAEHPGVASVIRELDLDAAGVTDVSAVVVATQGHYDEDALERALKTPAAYVGLVASRKRADNVLAYLRHRGLSEDQLARVRAPAGLDLGHVSNAEIAVAILAELVQLRASGAIGRVAAAHEPPTSEVHDALDPVCGMTVKVGTARHRSTSAGHTHYFCSAGCLASFEKDPAAYARAE